MLALLILGASETLSAFILIALGALVVPFGFSVFMLLEGWRPLGSSQAYDEMETERMDDALLFCDYVDQPRLASTANQKDVEPVPDKRERGTRTEHGADVGAGAHGLRAKFSRNRERDEREYFDVQKDPNTVLKAVLQRLIDAGDLDRSVGSAPLLPIDNAALEMLREASQDESADQLRQRLVLVAKKSELEGIAKQSPIVLVDDEWAVTKAGPVISISLRRLGPVHSPYRTYHDDMPEPIPMPDGLSISATFPESGVIDPVKTRLRDGVTVHAGVLATVVSYKDGVLDLDPIAVFGRHGAPGMQRGVQGSHAVGC
jgi:hypothetical protein